MLRRDPTLIQIDQEAVKEVKAALEGREESGGDTGNDANDSMLVDVDSPGKQAQGQGQGPYNAIEEDKKRRAAMTQAQRMGIADWGRRLISDRPKDYQIHGPVESTKDEGRDPKESLFLPMCISGLNSCTITLCRFIEYTLCLQ